MSADALKRAAAARAVALVEDGMALGLGTGSTAAHFVALLGERVREGLSVVGVPTSEATARAAREAGIPLTTLEERDRLDLTIDGADELDDALRLIKGGGGALLREKIVAAASARMVVIADASKRVAALGAFPLPVEVVPFGLAATRRHVDAAIRRAGCAGPLTLRQAGEGPFLTEPERLAAAFAAVPGVVEHGLFLGLATGAILAAEDGVRDLGVVRP